MRTKNVDNDGGVTHIRTLPLHCALVEAAQPHAGTSEKSGACLCIRSALRLRYSPIIQCKNTLISTNVPNKLKYQIISNIIVPFNCVSKM
jgi:hypothetical protein